MSDFIFIGGLVVLGFVLWQNWARRRQIAHIRSFPYRRFLEQRLLNRYPLLMPEQRDEVFAALRDYFLLCHRGGRRELSMPSRVAGDLWQEFVLLGPRYEKFCSAAFGRRLRHMPSEVMLSPKQADLGLRRTWRLACAHEDINPQAASRQPRLFALDARLGLVAAPSDPAHYARRGIYGSSGDSPDSYQRIDGYRPSEQEIWAGSRGFGSGYGSADSSSASCDSSDSSSSDSGSCSAD
ncbi:MAG: hypothetical protein WAV95_00880 [Azonexus sp.]